MAQTSNSRPTLKTLIKEFPSIGDKLTMMDPTVRDSLDDRSLAILEGANLEHALEFAIRYKMRHLSQEDTDKIFTGEGPLATFSAKIKIGYAFEIFGRNTRNELDRIRNIRNVFAHARALVSFLTGPLKEECAKLRFDKIGRPHFSIYPKSRAWPPTDPKSQYFHAASNLGTQLTLWTIPEMRENSPLGKEWNLAPLD